MIEDNNPKVMKEYSKYKDALENGVIKNAIEYEYPKDAKMIVSQLNSKNQVIQRTLIPKKKDKK